MNTDNNLTNEERAKEFLDYVNDHYDELKTALCKNCNYRSELVHDVFTEAIIKVHKSILKNNTPIKSYKNFFFTAVRLLYLSRVEQYERRKKQHIREPWHNDENKQPLDQQEEDPREETLDLISQVLIEIYNLLVNEFGEKETNLYFEYIRKNEKYNCIIKKIKKFIKTDPRIEDIKRQYEINLNGIYQ